MSKTERKSIAVPEFEVDLDQRLIQGYFSRFTADPTGDLTKKGTFTKTIQERGPRETKSGVRSKIKMGYNHGETIGIPVTIVEDDTGAYFEGRVSKTALGDDVLTKVDDGTIDGCSFEYRTIKAAYPKGDKSVNRVLEEVKLIEVGPVDYPMHEGAAIIGRKSREDVGELCNQLMFYLTKKSDDLSELEELKAVYNELALRFETAEEEVVPEIKSQPKGEAIFRLLREFNENFKQI